MNTFITIISTVITWLLGKQFLLPQIVRLWNYIKEKKKEQDKSNVDSTKELIEIKQNNNDLYQNQISFLVKQVEYFENELLNYQSQLELLRKKILELNNQLYSKSLIIGKLRQYCCANEDCKYRIYCSDEFCNLTTLEK